MSRNRTTVNKFMHTGGGHVCETFKIYGGNTTETLGCLLE